MKLDEDKEVVTYHLPTEILQQILVRLSPTDLKSAAMVSWRWKEVAEDPRTNPWRIWRQSHGPIKINKAHKSIFTGKEIRFLEKFKSKKMDLKYYYSFDIAGIGGFMDYIPHQQGENLAMADIDWVGTNVKYKCPIRDCWANDGWIMDGREQRRFGYLYFSVHVASYHGLVVAWMWKNLEKYPGLEEVLQMIDEVPEECCFQDPIIQWVHTNILTGKKTLLLPDNKPPRMLKYDYSEHITKIGGFINNIPHEQGEGLALADLDWTGTTVQYECPISGCWVTDRKNFGYKEFSIHIAMDHGLLEVWMRANLVKYPGLEEASHLIEGKKIYSLEVYTSGFRFHCPVKINNELCRFYIRTEEEPNQYRYAVQVIEHLYLSHGVTGQMMLEAPRETYMFKKFNEKKTKINFNIERKI